MKTRLRLVVALCAALLISCGLSACRTHVGAAAYVGDFRISEKTVDSYLTSRAKPYDASTSTGTTRIVPKPYVLTLLIEQRIFERTLTPAGGPPTTAELTKAHDTLLASTTDAAVAAQFAGHGFAPSLEPMLVKTAELNQVISTRFTTTAARNRALASFQALGAEVRVSPGYGSWDAKTLSVSGVSTPSFLRLNPAPATPAA